MKPCYRLRYFYVPRGAWQGCRCYPGLEAAADDYVRLAGNPAVGAVEIFDTRGSLLWADAWVDVPLVTAVARVREAVSAVKALG